MECITSNVIFQNPNKESLEKVQLTISNNGINQTFPALSKHFVEKRYFLFYEAPQFYTADGNEIIGAREHWIELITYINDDLNWLRSLPYFRFWSNVIYNPEIKKMLRIFLQNAPSHYNLDSLPNYKDIKDLLNKLFHNVLIIFARLVTNTESSTEFMNKDVQGKLLYENYIFTVPIIFDLCQHYGKENKKVVSKLMESIFTLQPKYLDDLKVAINHITQIFRSVEQRFEDCPKLLVGETVRLEERGGKNIEISLPVLEDIIVHCYDIIFTIQIFLDIYSPAISIFYNDEFIKQLVTIYSNTLPEMYKRLNSLVSNDENTKKCMKLMQFLDAMRIESLQVFRIVLYKDVGDVLEATHTLPEEEIRNRVNRFVEILTDALSEAEFMADYICLYPVDVDIDILTHIYPNIDSEKLDYINKIIFSATVNSNETSNQNNKDDAVNNIAELPNSSRNSEPISEEYLASLISEVKDILCDLDEGFIMKCLKYYNYNCERVIAAVLEDDLPAEIKNEKSTYSAASTSSSQVKFDSDPSTSAANIDELCDQITSIITTDEANQKRNRYKDVNQMLNDKTHIKQNMDIYNRYNLIIDEYENEYDDVYDDQDIGPNVQDDIIEVDRPFTMPRVLQKNKGQFENVADDEEESEEETKNNADHFVQDPALLREKAAQRMLSKRGRGGKGGPPPSDRDVTGKPKGQGQSKTVLSNRDNKNTHKSSQANHNRRAGSSWKKRQGMIPS